MLLVDVLIALAVSAVVMVALMFLFRLHGPASRMSLVAFAVFLATWVGGLWLTPFGPTIRGAYWAPFLAVGLVFALIWVAISPWPGRRGLRRPVPTGSGTEQAAPEEATISGFFWLLIVVLGALIVVGYLNG